MNALDGVPTVRARLRGATDAVHQALHHAAPFAAIAEGRSTRESYVATLRFLHCFHGGVAPLCAVGAQALNRPELAQSHATRVAALVNDLAYFGETPDAPPAEPVQPDGFCIGVLYTVQGSTLGGKVICRQLDALLPDMDGRSFFAGTPRDGRDWQTLSAALEERGDFADLEAGAQFAFARFAQMLERKT